MRLLKKKFPGLLTQLRRQRFAVIVGVIGVVLTAAALLVVHYELSARFRHDIALAARQRYIAINDHLTHSLDELRELQGALEQLPRIDPPLFRSLAEATQRHHSAHLLELEWLPRVCATQRAEFEAALATTAQECAIQDLLPDGSRHPAPERPQYFPLTITVPERDDSIGYGIDLATHPQRGHLLRHAIHTGTASSSPAITLPNGDRVLLVFMPVQGNLDFAAHDTGSQLRGVVGVVVGLAQIVDHAISHLEPEGIEFALEEVTPAGQSHPIFFHPSRRHETETTISRMTPPPTPPWFKKRLTVIDQTWEFQAWPAAGMHSDLKVMLLHLGAAGGGMLLTALLVIHLVRTRNELEERIRWQRSLLEREAQFQAVAQTAHDAIIVCDATGSIRFWNQGAATIFGYSPEEITGHSLNELIPQRLRAIHTAGMARIRDHCVIPWKVREVTAQRRDGTEFPCELSLASWESGTERLFSAVVRDITLRKQAEEQLKQSETRFRQLFVAMINGFALHEIVLDDQGRPCDYRFLEVNPAFTALTGLARERVIGQPVSAVMPQVDPMLIATYGEVALTGQSAWFEFFAHDLNKYFEIIAYCPAPGQFATVFADTTQHHAARRELHQSEERLRAIFLQFPDLILLSTPDGVVYFSNHDELPTITTAITTSQVYRHELGLVLAHGKGRMFELRLPSANWWEVRVLPITAPEDQGTILTVASDITTQKQLQTQTIRNARLATLGVLTASIAHEVNNPNNAILFNLASLTRIWENSAPLLAELTAIHGDATIGEVNYSWLRDNIPRLLTGIGNGSRRIEEIVKNLKGMAKQEADDCCAPIDLFQMIHSAVGILQSRIVKHTTAFSLRLAEELPPLCGNHQQLEQLVINLVINALESLPDQRAAVEVAVEATAEQVLLRVSDAGCGIPPEQLPLICNPFFTTKAESGGTGLGLSISRMIVKNHGGTLEFTSTPGVGTTATVRLPIQRGPCNIGNEITDLQPYPAALGQPVAFFHSRNQP